MKFLVLESAGSEFLEIILGLRIIDEKCSSLGLEFWNQGLAVSQSLKVFLLLKEVSDFERSQCRNSSTDQKVVSHLQDIPSFTQVMKGLKAWPKG